MVVHLPLAYTRPSDSQHHVETEKGKSYNREETYIALFSIPFRDNLWVVVRSHLLDSVLKTPGQWNPADSTGCGLCHSLKCNSDFIPCFS